MRSNVPRRKRCSRSSSKKKGLKLLGWRTVPVIPEVLGHKAVECMPCIMQAFIEKAGRGGKRY